MSVESVFIPEEGSLEIMRAVIEDAAGPLTARLYSNDIPYSPSITLADLVEAAFTGYQPVNPIMWSTPSINGDGKAQSDSNALSFTFTGGSGTAAVYGLYLTDDTNTKLWAIMPFVPAVVLAPAQPSVSRIVQLTDVSEL